MFFGNALNNFTPWKVSMLFCSLDVYGPVYLITHIRPNLRWSLDLKPLLLFGTRFSSIFHVYIHVYNMYIFNTVSLSPLHSLPRSGKKSKVEITQMLKFHFFQKVYTLNHTIWPFLAFLKVFWFLEACLNSGSGGKMLFLQNFANFFKMTISRPQIMMLTPSFWSSLPYTLGFRENCRIWSCLLLNGPKTKLFHQN